MMKKIVYLLFVICLAQSILAQDVCVDVKKRIKDNSILVVSHRADWRNAPENSLQAIKNCIDMGVDMVEIDLKRTKDGKLVIIHDKTIDRVMTGKGKPSDYTLDELKAMRLRSGTGHATRHQIATLEEVMDLCKGKIMVNIDQGYDFFPQVYEILKSTGTLKQCIIKSSEPYERLKKENGKYLKDVFYMPIIKINKDNADELYEAYRKNLKPRAYELVFAKDDDKAINFISEVSKNGAFPFINSLWPELCGGHDDDRAVELLQPDESWGWIVNQGAKFIQTDRPALLIEYLRKHNLHK